MLRCSYFNPETSGTLLLATKETRLCVLRAGDPVKNGEDGSFSFTSEVK